MTARYTRRAALAAIGGVSVGAAIAGCLGSDDRFWDDPPSFDSTGLEAATDDPLPERPAPIPATLADAHLETVVDRIDDLLEPIPDPLTVETIPNGEIRTEIDDERAAALEARAELIERIEQPSPEVLSTVQTAVDARGHAAAAATVWAAVSTDRSAADVIPEQSEIRSKTNPLAERVPGEAAGPAEGTVVYGAIEGWLDRGLTGSPRRSETPIRAGRRGKQLERASAEADAAAHLYQRYVDSLESPRSITDALTGAIDDLAPMVNEQFDRYYEDEDYLPHRHVDPETLLDRDVRPDEPGVELLSRTITETNERAWDGPLAWPGDDVSFPAEAVRRTHHTLAAFEGIDALVDRVNDGDDLFPVDGTVVREARLAAIDAVAELGASDSPLDVRLAWTLVDAFDEPDAALQSAADRDPSLRRVATAYGDYVRIETIARAASNATETVERALGER